MIKIYNWDEIKTAQLDTIFSLQQGIKFGELQVFNRKCTVAIIYPTYNRGININSFITFKEFTGFKTWAQFDEYWSRTFDKYLILEC